MTVEDFCDTYPQWREAVNSMAKRLRQQFNLNPQHVLTYNDKPHLVVRTRTNGACLFDGLSKALAVAPSLHVSAPGCVCGEGGQASRPLICGS